MKNTTTEKMQRAREIAEKRHANDIHIAKLIDTGKHTGSKSQARLKQAARRYAN